MVEEDVAAGPVQPRESTFDKQGVLKHAAGQADGDRCG